MKRLLTTMALVLGLLLSTVRAIASQDVDHMSNIEVSEYAIRMSEAIDDIRENRLCHSDDISCLRTEFLRHGVDYDDKRAVQKRIVIMIGSIY